MTATRTDLRPEIATRTRTREAGNLLIGTSFFDESCDMWLIITGITVTGNDTVIFGTPLGNRMFRFSDKLTTNF